MAKEIEFDCKAVTKTMCAAVQNGRACLGIRVVDETDELVNREFDCKFYHTHLERKDTSFAGRKVIVCKRCAQCKQDHPSGHQPDFDDPLLRKYLNY